MSIPHIRQADINDANTITTLLQSCAQAMSQQGMAPLAWRLR